MWWVEPGHLEVKNNQLSVGGHLATDLAGRHGTPLYVYNGDKILKNFRLVRDALARHADNFCIHYAVKANAHVQVLKLLGQEGAHADCVSPIECRLALKAGIGKERILFTGTSVSNRDLAELVDLGVRINIDSLSQLRRLATFSRSPEISIRWNPGEGSGAGLHSHTITAGKYIKFGIPEAKVLDAFREASELGMKVVGLHQHIGSGWLGDDVRVFLGSVRRTLEVAREAERILGRPFRFIDFGGGPGIRYREEQSPFPIEEYARGLVEAVRTAGFSCTLAIEPGRYFVAESGVLLLEINTVEEKNVPVIGVDGGFNTLVRPAFYGAHHEMVLCNRVRGPCERTFMVAGNLCESSDVFNENKKELRPLPEPREGDILAILCAGAYGYEMGSAYNGRPLPAQVLLLGGKDYRITERGNFEAIVGGQALTTK
ncbi:MAG: diaminopimelate decarboxylase [Planctomycetes bacterium]|nr:diaminopimelate decarboxylase [Planctomycetota bacterium]